MSNRHLYLLIVTFTAFIGPLFGGEETAAPFRQKVIVADFEDAGTWRATGKHGTKIESWFAGGLYLGGTQKEQWHDAYVGELKFAFDPTSASPYWVSFTRYKMSLISGTLDGIEFEADSKNLPVTIGFILEDANGKKFKTTSIPLSGPWRSYRMDLTTKTLPGLEECHFPARLHAINLNASAACEGSIFLDNIAMTGVFKNSDLVSIFPISDGIAFSPNRPVTLRYRLRNAKPGALAVDARVEVQNSLGRTIFTTKSKTTIPEWNAASLTFSMPRLKTDAYTAKVSLNANGEQITYDDSFCVFVPNGKRLNHAPMWFGICDPANSNSEGETKLHLEWMKALGIDLNRIDTTGNGSMEPKEGQFGFAGWERIFNAFSSAGIDLDLLYVSTPHWTHPKVPDGRSVPEDFDAFRRHITAVGGFVRRYPAIKYYEFWNEPDAGASFQGSAQDYLKMLNVFSAAMHATAPGIKVTGAGLCVFHPKERQGVQEGHSFSEDAIKYGGADYDIAAIHSHGPLGNYENIEETVEKWMQQAGIQKPICNTESGERSFYNPGGRLNQAITLVKKVTYAKSRSSTEFYSWFTLQDYWDMDPKADDSFGLVTSDNRAKPSFLAYNTLIRELADTEPLSTPLLGSDVKNYSFKKNDGNLVTVCWPSPGRSSGVVWIKAKDPVYISDIFGNTKTLSQLGGIYPLAIGAQPVYVKTNLHQLQQAAAQDKFLVFDPEIPVLEGNPTRFPITLKAPNHTAISGKLILQDQDGTLIDEQAVFCISDAQQTYYLSLPDKAVTNDATITLSLDEKDHPSFTFPIHVVHPYWIAKAPGDPLTEALTSFVQKLPAIVLNKQSDVADLAFDPAIPRWGGPADLSCKARACYTEQGLFFRFEVMDDKHVQNNPPEKLWNGDSVQIALAAPGLSNDYVVLSIGLTPNGPVAWCDQGPSAAKGRWDIPLKIERKDNLTRYDVFIPFERLGATRDQFNGTLRFSFLLNEDDGLGRVRVMPWHEGIGASRDYDRLGHGVLAH
ncbi:MAG: glycosyl hydrolase [Chthoniobacteraceae bacterium]